MDTAGYPVKSVVFSPKTEARNCVCTLENAHVQLFTVVLRDALVGEANISCDDYL